MKIRPLEKTSFSRERLVISEFNRFVLLRVQPAAPGLTCEFNSGQNCPETLYRLYQKSLFSSSHICGAKFQGLQDANEDTPKSLFVFA